MSEQFEGQDLADAMFWSVDLSRATFEDVNLTSVSIRRALAVDLTIDGLVEHVTINGVDVTQYVNERDRWYPLRALLRPSDPAGMRVAWHALDEQWSAAIERARQLTDAQRHESVGGEWSFVDTLRHLVFAIDKWFLVPVLGEATFHEIGLPNTGSVDVGWPGIVSDASPTFGEVLAVRSECASRLTAFLDDVSPADLTRDAEVIENGTVPVHECIWVVFEEEFEHLRYAVRDLALLA